MDRNSERLLEQTIREVNAEFEMMQRKYPTVHYWQPGGMEVTFCNEPGEGAGVRRSFFTAIAEVNEGGNSSVYMCHVRTYVCCTVVKMIFSVAGCPVPGESNASHP